MRAGDEPQLAHKPPRVVRCQAMLRQQQLQLVITNIDPAVVRMALRSDFATSRRSFHLAKIAHCSRSSSTVASPADLPAIALHRSLDRSIS
ncbi:hypothetical protein [Streptomyces sp. NPDC014746]|uniref:hypothetical protein n=1 Tax=Streptomyces sp. NPDC014746 TaxID=3364904 RepID=UPI0036F75969